MGILTFFKDRRRERLLARYPIPDELWSRALEDHPILYGLDEGELSRLRETTTLFLAEKDLLYAAGAEPDEEAALSVAVQACLPVLNLGLAWYDDWSAIILTPKGYTIRKRETDEAGVVREYDDEVGGEVLELGPIVLSLRDVADSGWGSGYNVVIHEMAHKLDGRTGTIDGRPPLRKDLDPEAWRSAFAAAFEKIRASLSGSIKSSLLKRFDDYAAEHPTEFFAVACEYFFERPHLLKAVFPAVYDLLAEFFRQDPALRKRSESASGNGRRRSRRFVK